MEVEVLVKRKGVVQRTGLDGVSSKGASRWGRTGYEAYGVGRAGSELRGLDASMMSVVIPAVVR